MKTPATPALRCAICNRPISDRDPLHVFGIGYVGSTCHKKVQDIEERLTELGLQALFQQAFYPMVQAGEGYRYSPEALKLAADARSKGLDVKITVQKGAHGPVNVLTLKSPALSKILTPQPPYGGAA